MDITDVRKIALIDKNGKVMYINIDPEDKVSATVDIHNVGDVYFRNGHFINVPSLHMTNGDIKIEFSPDRTDNEIHECNTIGAFIDEIMK